ncbi:membrane protein [Staphylococcus aureus]|nr:membrane protein [Staphylococcus aureus]
MTVNIVFSIVFCISMVILGIYVAITKDFTLISFINQTIADKHKNQIAYIFTLCISLSAVFLMSSILSFEYDFIALAFLFLTIALLLIALFYVCFYKITKYP